MNKGIYLLLGSNMGDAFAHLNNAIEALKKLPIEVIKISSVYKTAAWGKTDQNPFLNQCLEIKTDLKPEELLHLILQTELDLGRTRLEKWAERIIDIDILYFGSEIIHSQNLQVPHPYLHQRRFTLVPLCEISPDFVHPLLQLSNVDLLKNCEDLLDVEKL
jgi:2-amino-4-hydroxy-6-hydroxymethyldihydropteridine diphosphokinase